MKLIWGLVTPCLAMACTAVSAAPRQAVNMVWMIEPLANFQPTERLIEDGAHIFKQRLIPVGLATLSGEVAVNTGNKLVVRTGTQLVQALTSEGQIFCALKTMRTEKSGGLIDNERPVTICLLDGDKNGRFDAAFEVASSPTGVVMQGQLPKQPNVVDVAYEVRPVTEFKGDYWVGIRYEQYFNIYGNRMLMTDFGGRGATQSLTAFDTFKSKGLFPRPVSVLGARFVIVAPEEKGVRVKIESAMPAQPFGVVTTTTYRIY